MTDVEIEVNFIPEQLDLGSVVHNTFFSFQKLFSAMDEKSQERILLFAVRSLLSASGKSFYFLEDEMG